MCFTTYPYFFMKNHILYWPASKKILNLHLMLYIMIYYGLEKTGYNHPPTHI